MPRFSANLGFLWPDRPLLDRIEAAAAAGFKAVELHWPYDVPAGEVQAACRRHGLATLGLNTPVGDRAKGEFGLGALPGREREFQDGVDLAIRYCLDSGLTSIHCMPGVIDPSQRAAARKVLTANLIEAAEKAGKHGLTLLLEPINQRDRPGYFYSTVEDACEMIDRVEAPNVKIMFDCYHVGVQQGDVITRLREHVGRIGHVQIAAVPSRHEPDEGEIAYGAIFAELDAIGYAGWVGCEYLPRGDTDAGLAWAEALGVTL